MLKVSLKKYGLGLILGICLAQISLIPLKISIASSQAPLPEAMLILGGDPKREQAGAAIAKHYPDMLIWVSTGEQPQIVRSTFQKAGVEQDRLILDYQASDTVTNFTTLIPEFKRHNIRHLYIVTSNFHRRRAKAVGTLVLGSQGIIFTLVAIESDRPSEPTSKMIRDAIRSLLWLMTGRTGAEYVNLGD